MASSASTVAGQAAPDPSLDVVCVPLALDAFVLNEAVCSPTLKAKVGPLALPDYAALGRGQYLKPDVVEHIDSHATSPASVNTRITDVAGTGRARTDRLGIYLHWSLPKAMRSGITATASAAKDQANARLKGGLPDPEEDKPVEFRPIPDRYFVFRYISKATVASGKAADELTQAPPVTAFVLESNRIRKLEEFKLNQDIETEATPFYDKGQAHEQDNVFVGLKSSLDSWNEPQPPSSGLSEDRNAARYRSPLTIDCSASHVFADFQPHNPNVFSIHDDLTYPGANGQIATLQSATVSYFIFGYYHIPAQDPFTVDQAAAAKAKIERPSHQEILNSCYMELQNNTGLSKWLEDSTKDSRLVCHGAKYNVEWDLSAAPADIPANTIATAFEATHPVAVGADNMDALAAYYEAHISDSDQADISTMIRNISTLTESGDGSVHAQKQAAKTVLKNHFAPIGGGSYWHLRIDEKETSTKPAASGGALLPANLSSRPNNATIETLNQLNICQSQLEASLRRRSQLRFLLYCEWWKARTEPIDATGKVIETPETVSVLAAISDRVKVIVEELKKLSQIIESRTNDIIKITKITDADKGSPFQQSANDVFYTRKNPTVLLAGLESPWPENFLDGNLGVRLTSQLPLGDASATDGDVKSKSLADWKLSISGDAKPTDFRDLLEKIANGVLGITSVSAEKRRWLLAWKKVKTLGIAKAPIILQPSLAHLLTEWIFLSSNTYKQLKDTFPPTYFKPNDTTDRLNWKSQAWFPLFVEWEVEYFHIPFDDWSLFHESDGSITYGLKSNIQISLQKGISQNKNRISGRSTLTGHIVQMLRDQVEVFFKSTPEAQLKLDAAAQTKVLAELSKLPFMSTQLEGFREGLLTLHKGAHVIPSDISATPHAQGDATFTVEVMAYLVSARAGLEQCWTNLQKLGWVEDAQMDFTPVWKHVESGTHRPNSKRAAISPFKPVTHGQVRFTKLNIIDKFGQIVCAVKRDADEVTVPLLPYTSKYLSCQPVLSPDSSLGPYFANTVFQDPEGQCQFFQLPPSINQEVRLDSRFVILESPKASGFAFWRPTNEWENPIWGWIAMNYRDGGLNIYDEKGGFVAEALLRENDVYWLPEGVLFPKDAIPTNATFHKPQEHRRVQLQEFLQKLGSEHYTRSLMQLIRGALETLHPAPNTYADRLPAILGRPLALVNVGWSLELAEAPMHTQSYEDSATEKHLLDYKFALKIGDKNNYNDGVIGYFSEARGHEGTKEPVSTIGKFDYSTMVTEFELEKKHRGTEGAIKTTSTLPRLSPFYVNPVDLNEEEYRRRHHENYTVFATIVDPFSYVTGYTGILPPKQLQIPPMCVETALKQMALFIHVGPFLISSDVESVRDLPAAGLGAHRETAVATTKQDKAPPRITVPPPTNDDWVWLQPRNVEGSAKQIEYVELGLSKDVGAMPSSGPHTAVEGFLQIRNDSTEPDHTSPLPKNPGFVAQPTKVAVEPLMSNDKLASGIATVGVENPHFEAVYFQDKHGRVRLSHLSGTGGADGKGTNGFWQGSTSVVGSDAREGTALAAEYYVPSPGQKGTTLVYYVSQHGKICEAKGSGDIDSTYQARQIGSTKGFEVFEGSRISALMETLTDAKGNKSDTISIFAQNKKLHVIQYRRILGGTTDTDFDEVFDLGIAIAGTDISAGIIQGQRHVFFQQRLDRIFDIACSENANGQASFSVKSINVPIRALSPIACATWDKSTRAQLVFTDKAGKLFVSLFKDGEFGVHNDANISEALAQLTESAALAVNTSDDEEFERLKVYYTARNSSTVPEIGYEGGTPYAFKSMDTDVLTK